MYTRVEFEKRKTHRRMRTRHMPTRVENAEGRGKGSYSRSNEKNVNSYLDELEADIAADVEELNSYFED